MKKKDLDEKKGLADGFLRNKILTRKKSQREKETQ